MPFGRKKKQVTLLTTSNGRISEVPRYSGPTSFSQSMGDLSLPQITHRFTINLPGGQKAVMRISPQLTLEQVFSRVCQDKSLDSRRFVLQHPDNPLTPLDLKASIADSRLTEINLIHAGAASTVGDSSRSMPDLYRGTAASGPSGLSAASAASQDPASWYMPGAGEPKKKKGFLSFLSKKDKKKFNPHDTRYTATTTNTHPPASQYPPQQQHPSHPSTSKTTTLPPPRKASTPPAQRRRSDTTNSAPAARPMSVFVAGGGAGGGAGGSSPRGADGSSVAASASKTPAAPAPGKKRPAPPPPPKKKASAPAPAPATVPNPIAATGSNDSGLSAGLAEHPEEKATTTSTATATSTAATTAAVGGVKPVAEAPAPAVSSARHAEAAASGLSRLHSRNSSDSSGYHDLTLSGAESPEADSPHVRVSSALKTSLDTTSIESADHPNGDSGVQDLTPGSEGSIPTTAATAADKPPAIPGGGGGMVGKGGAPMALPQSGQQLNSQTPGLGKPDKRPKPLPSTKKKKAPPPPPKAKPAPVPEESVGAVSSQSKPPTVASPPTAPPTAPPTSPPTSTPTSTSVPETEEQSPLPPPQHFQDDITVTTAVTHAQAEYLTPTSTPREEGGGGEGAADVEENSDADSGEAFNLNDILDAVEFEDPPLSTTTTTNNTDITSSTSTSTTITTSRKYSEEEEEEDGEEEEEPRRLAMMETDSVLSEDVQVPEDRSRPCEFIPPPPPDEPPPPEDDYPLPATQYPPPLEYCGQETRYQDKGTVVGEDNASLAPESLKGSPVSKQGYPNEMARFVAQMSRLTTQPGGAAGVGDKPPDSADLSSNNTSLSLPDTESASDTGSVIFHARVGSKDSQTSVSSQDRPAPSSVVSGGSGLVPSMMQEMDAPPETVPPPLEFQGDGEKEEEEEEEEEEQVRVVTEEYILPVGPSGPDYSSAVKVSETASFTRPARRAEEGSDKVFRAEPVTILPSVQSQVVVEREKPAAKEEFVLTMEDLTSVSMVPPRPKMSSASPVPAVKPAPIELDRRLQPDQEPAAETAKNVAPTLARIPVANVSRILGGHSERTEARSTTDFNPKKPPPASNSSGARQGSTTSADKPLTTLFLPSMRYTSHNVEPMSFSDDDRSSESSSDHVQGGPRAALGGGRAADDAASDVSSERPGGLDSRRMSSSSNASQSQPGQADADHDPAREELQRQYAALQDQFVLWQQQLQQNQALLAAHGSGSADHANDDDTLRTLQAQVQLQQQMMTQLQTSMQALAVQQQLHQQQQRGMGVAVEDAPAPPVDIPSPAEESTPFQSSLSPPSYPPPPPPIEGPEPQSSSPPRSSSPPPPPPPFVPVLNAPKPKVIKAAAKPRPSAASRFEPQLDPREQLMMAIRSFGGRGELKAVPVQETSWHNTK